RRLIVLPIWAGTIQLVPLRTLICVCRHTNLEQLMKLFVAVSLLRSRDMLELLLLACRHSKIWKTSTRPTVLL
ncbi:unnamed protein product, partial [Symbiodinium sp. CCMP2456]